MLVSRKWHSRNYHSLKMPGSIHKYTGHRPLNAHLSVRNTIHTTTNHWKCLVINTVDRPHIFKHLPSVGNGIHTTTNHWRGMAINKHMYTDHTSLNTCLSPWNRLRSHNHQQQMTHGINTYIYTDHTSLNTRLNCLVNQYSSSRHLAGKWTDHGSNLLSFTCSVSFTHYLQTLSCG